MTVNSSQVAQASWTKDTGACAPAVIHELAQRPLFASLAPLLSALPGPGPCGLGRLNALHRAQRLAEHADRTALRFVPPDDSPIVYEERIVRHAEVVTRPDNWHDFFNALVWLRFPRTKMCLAEIHARGISAPTSIGRRGAVRDAATQFDESGIVVAASDPSLLDLLQARRWKELFWTRRSDVAGRMRFLVFGHGLYDALRAPFYRICGRAAMVVVSQEWIDEGVERQCEHLDAIVAARFADRTWYPRPKSLLALPLLGIPGVCAENEQPGYYDDTVQFRAAPVAAGRG